MTHASQVASPWPRAAATAGAGAVLPHACDVTDRDAVGRLADWTEAEVGSPAIVVNSAGTIRCWRREASTGGAN